MEANKYVKGALVLTLAGIISKILSAGYRIPLQNLTGDIGFYIYQQVYPILGMAIVLSLYGFPAAVSKLAAEKEVISLKYFILPLWLIVFILCSFFAILLYGNAGSIAEFAGDEKLVHAYQIASIILLLIPFTSVLRGVFQGRLEMKPTAYSQIGEQLFRVGIIIGVAVIIAFGKVDVYWIGTTAGIASIVGALVAFIILIVCFVNIKPVSKIKQSIPWKEYIRTIFVYGFIASLSHMILLIIQFADSFTVVPGLYEYGLTQTAAMEAKGIFDRGQPLIQIGAVLGSSFGLALLPTIAKGTYTKNTSELSEQIGSSIKISFYLAWGASIGLILLFPEINRLLYQDNQGDFALTILMIATLLSSIVITTSSILQGMGYVKFIAFFILVTFAIKWLSNMLFVPMFGIVGSSLGTIVSLLFLVMVSWAKLRRENRNTKLVRIKWKAFVIATVSMVSFVLLVQNLLPIDTFSRLALFFTVIGISGFGAIIYIFLLIRFKALTNQEQSILPFISKIHRRKGEVE